MIEVHATTSHPKIVIAMKHPWCFSSSSTHGVKRRSGSQLNSILEEFHFESGPSLYSGLSLEESPSQLKHVSLPLRGWVSVSNGYKLWIGCLVGDYQESNVGF